MYRVGCHIKPITPVKFLIFWPDRGKPIPFKIPGPHLVFYSLFQGKFVKFSDLRFQFLHKWRADSMVHQLRIHEHTLVSVFLFIIIIFFHIGFSLISIYIYICHARCKQIIGVCFIQNCNEYHMYQIINFRIIFCRPTSSSSFAWTHETRFHAKQNSP